MAHTSCPMWAMLARSRRAGGEGPLSSISSPSRFEGSRGCSMRGAGIAKRHTLTSLSTLFTGHSSLCTGEKTFSFLQLTTVQSQRFCEYAIYPVVAQLGSWLPWQTVASLATPAFRAPGQPLWRCMLNRECMQNDGSFGAWLKLYVLGKWRITHRTAWPPQPNGSHWASAAVPQPKRRMLRTSCNP